MNPTLTMTRNGMVLVIVNGKQMDTGRFLYNVQRDSPEDIEEQLKVKLREFFNWYSTFQNIEPITRVTLCSPDFMCESGCKVLQLRKKYSVVDILISKANLIKLLEEVGTKHNMEIALEGAKEF